MNKRRLFSKVFNLISDAKLIKLRKTIMPSRKVTILAYHGIIDIIPKNYDYSTGCISATLDQFDSQMAFIKNNFNVMTFHTLQYEYLLKKRFPKDALIITFDDGYMNNFEIAYPVLKKYNLPAAIFIITDHIGKDNLFWFDKLHYWLKTTPLKSIKVKTNKEYFYDLSNRANLDSKIGEIAEQLKGIENKERLSCLNQIYEQVKNTLKPPISPPKPLDWESIKEMKQNGIEFGSHTVNHPIISRLTFEELSKELIQSKKKIEKELDCECLAFSYPNGQKNDFGKREMSLLKRLGYNFAVSYIEGVNYLSNLNKFNLLRLHIELDTTFQFFRMKFLFPNL